MSADGEFAFPAAPSPAELAKFPLNDLGNALRLIRLVGGVIEDDGSIDTRNCQLLFLRDRGWIAFNGQFWDLRGGEQLARRFAHKVAGGLVAQGEHTGAPAKAWADFVARTGNAGSSSAMLAQAAPYLEAELSDFDADPLALNVANGVLSFKPLRGGAYKAQFRANHYPADRMTRICGAPWDPSAARPHFDALVGFCQPKPENARYLQTVLGYGATGSTKEQIFLILQGRGGDGKSTLVGAVREALGSYAVTAAIETFLDSGVKRGGDASPDIARLAGDSRLICTGENPRGSKLATAMIKAFTGGAPMTARDLRQGIFEFSPKGKVVLECNGRPVISDSDDGIWRRLSILLFRHQVERERIDRDLPEKLRGELAGVLAWLIEGALIWLAEGIVEPADVAEARSDYRTSSNPFGEWFASFVIREDGAVTSAADFYNSYKRFCEDEGHKEMGQTAFGRAMGEMQLTGKRLTGGRKARVGARLRETVVEDPFSAPAFEMRPGQFSRSSAGGPSGYHVDLDDSEASE